VLIYPTIFFFAQKNASLLQGDRVEDDSTLQRLACLHTLAAGFDAVQESNINN